MPGDALQPGPHSSEMETFRKWLHTAVAPLYRHELTLDEEALMRQVETRLAESRDGEEEGLDPAAHLHRTVGASVVELLRSAQRDAPEATASINAELFARVERVVSGLTAELQGTVGLYLQGFNRQEIAALTGWSDDEARQKVHAALKSLEERLHEAGIEYGAD